MKLFLTLAFLALVLQMLHAHEAHSKESLQNLLSKSAIKDKTGLPENMRQDAPSSDPPCRTRFFMRVTGCACFLRFERGVSDFDEIIVNDRAVCEDIFGPLERAIRSCRQILRTRRVRTRRATRFVLRAFNRCLPSP